VKRVLVFGASGQIGDALLPLLCEAQVDVVAVSRQPRDGPAGVAWLVGSLEEGPALPAPAFDAVFSLGPLDAFARWQERAGPVAPRVVAFGSTSAATKHLSDDAHERELADRLRGAEDALSDFGARRGVGITVLRPTLVYGRGRDRTVSRIAAIAARSGFFVLPRRSRGLRQPVHTDDLARAALSACGVAGTAGRAYDLPGGESLPFDAMVARILAALPNRPRLLRLPGPLFGAAAFMARASGTFEGLPPAAIARWSTDLVFDASDARRDFGWSPRAFAPAFD